MDKGEERFEGFLRGALGSLAGLAAMGLFFRAAQALSNGRGGSNGRGAASDGHSEDFIERHEALDDISLVGQQAREEEPATEAVGRMGYEALTGHDPDAETLHRLGQAVHWGYGVLLGGLYGAMREEADGPDFVGGLGYGTAAWVLGDELMVPLLGLAEGPTAHAWTVHARALGAHLVYGAATSSATHALKRVM
ncbi:MAG TPA: hypothetical protein VMM12_16265 [Longimicrobiales bacterium]|nr:hypothetical protein [Longimicrobiales bacterium]